MISCPITSTVCRVCNVAHAIQRSACREHASKEIVLANPLPSIDRERFARWVARYDVDNAPACVAVERRCSATHHFDPSHGLEAEIVEGGLTIGQGERHPVAQH